MATGWLPETSQSGGFLPPGTQQPLAASGAWLPATLSGPTYGSGLTLGASGQSLQESILKYNGSQLGQYMKAQQDQMMASLGLDPSVTDVSDISTLEADQAKNEAAIAKLATFNPDLAEELLRRHQGAPEESKGFFGDMLDTVGDFMQPALAVGAKALEILSRPAQIIPELIVDAEDDAWYEDIGQALSGKSHARGDDVIRRWFGDDTSGFMQGLGGFAVDILGDPLTYLTFGMASVGREAATTAAGKALTRVTMRDFAEKGALNIGSDMVDGVANKLVDDLINGGLMKGAISQDAAVAVAARSLDSVPAATVQQVMEQVNPILRQMNRTGFRNLDQATFEKWRPLLEKERSLLQSAGTRGARGEARALAGAMGGVRAVAGVPFTKFRFVSAAVPGSYGLSPFNPGKNFFRGMSGLNRLGKAIDGHIATGLIPNTVARETVFQTFFESGWEGLERSYPALMSELGPGRLGVDSMYRSVSEQVGRITSKMTNHGQFYRNGDLDALFAKNVYTVARGREKQFLDHEVWTDYDDNGRVVRSGRDFMDHVRDSLDLTDPTKRLGYARFMETVPGNDPAILGHLDEWESARAQVVSPEQAATERGRIEAAAKDISPGEMETLFTLKRRQKSMLVTANKNGAAMRDRGTDRESAANLNDPESLAWALENGGIREVAEVPYWMTAASDRLGVKDLAPTEYGRGFRMAKGTLEGEPTSVVTNAGGEFEVDLDMFSRMKRKAEADGGFTINPQDETDMAGGWAVAMKGRETSIDTNQRGWKDQAASWVDDNKDLLEQEGYSIGGWVDDGVLKMDVTRVVADANEARALGAANDQDAIFNLDDFVEERRVRARVAKPLRLDQGENTEFYNGILAEVEDGVRAMDINRTMLAVPYDEWYVGAVSEGITERLRMEGFDAVIDAEGGLTVFPPSDLTSKGASWNAKVIKRDAAEVKPHTGYFPRIVTDELKLKVFGAHHREDIVYLQDLEKTHERYRKLRDMDIVEANDFLRKEHGLSGDAFYVDPLEAHARYGQRVAADIKGNVLAGSAPRLARGWGDRWGVGTTVMVNQYGWRGGTMMQKNLAKFSEQHKKLLRKNSEKIQKQVSVLERQILRYDQEVARLRTEVAGLQPDTLGQVAVKGRQARGAANRSAVVLGESIEKARTRIRSIDAQLKKGRNTDKLMTERAALEKKVNAMTALRRKMAAGKLGPEAPERITEVQEALGEAVATRTDRISRLSAKQQRAQTKLDNIVSGAARELEKVKTRYQTELSGMVPAVMTGERNLLPVGFVTMSDIPGAGDFAMHPYMAAEFRHALGSKPISELRRGWRRFIQGPWKTWSTVYYPGFHARNFMGAYFNNWLGGVGPEHYMDSFRIARANKGDTKWTDALVGRAKAERWGLDGLHGKALDEVTYGDIADLMEEQMIRSNSSNVLADVMPDEAERIRRMAGRTKLRDKTPEPVQKALTPAKAYGRVMRQTTEVTENFFRTAAFLKGLDDTGNIVGARAFTMMRHGDYEDLNDFEQFVKDLVPFYKWMRTNIPFQVHQLLESPGKTLAAVKSQNATIVMAGEDPDLVKDKLPPWMRESYTLALPQGEKGDGLLKYLALDLPMSDLYTGANDYISAFLPMIRPLIEAKVMKSRLGPGGESIPLPDATELNAWAKLPGVRQILDPFITVNADGKETIPGDVQHILNVIPIFSRFKNVIYADDKAQARRGAMFWSAVVGVRPDDLTEEELTSYEKSFYYDDLLPLIEGLRELGVSLPEKTDIPAEVYTALGLDLPEEEGTTTGAFGSAFGG